MMLSMIHQIILLPRGRQHQKGKVISAIPVSRSENKAHQMTTTSSRLLWSAGTVLLQERGAKSCAARDPRLIILHHSRASSPVLSFIVNRQSLGEAKM